MPTTSRVRAPPNCAKCPAGEENSAPVSCSRPGLTGQARGRTAGGTCCPDPLGTEVTTTTLRGKHGPCGALRTAQQGKREQPHRQAQAGSAAAFVLPARGALYRRPPPSAPGPARPPFPPGISSLPGEKLFVKKSFQRCLKTFKEMVLGTIVTKRSLTVAYNDAFKGTICAVGLLK